MTPAGNTESFLRFVLDVSRTCAALLGSRECTVRFEAQLVDDGGDLFARGLDRSYRGARSAREVERETIASTQTRFAKGDSVFDCAQRAGTTLRANSDRSAGTSFAFCWRMVGPPCQSARSKFRVFSLSPAALRETTKPLR
jgi:hypothetical protein